MEHQRQWSLLDWVQLTTLLPPWEKKTQKHFNIFCMFHTHFYHSWFTCFLTLLSTFAHSFCARPVSLSQRTYKKVCFSLLSRQYWATFPTANLLGFNLWGRGLVTQKCTPRKTGAVLEPCWNLSLLDCKAGTICRLFCFKEKSQTKRVRNLLVRLSKEVGKQYFRVTNDFYLMELTMMKGGTWSNNT